MPLTILLGTYINIETPHRKGEMTSTSFHAAAELAVKPDFALLPLYGIALAF